MCAIKGATSFSRQEKYRIQVGTERIRSIPAAAAATIGMIEERIVYAIVTAIQPVFRYLPLYQTQVGNEWIRTIPAATAATIGMTEDRIVNAFVRASAASVMCQHACCGCESRLLCLFLFVFSLFLFHFFITNNLSRSFFIQHHLRRKTAAPTAIVEEIRISVTHVYHENLESSIPKVCNHSLL